MIFKTIVPKLGEVMYYLGKPVTNDEGIRIGSITDVKEDGDCLEITMNVEIELIKGESKDENIKCWLRNYKQGKNKWNGYIKGY